jgi:hypothetical protein
LPAEKRGIVIYKIAIPRLIEKPIMAARFASRCSSVTAWLTERSLKAARIFVPTGTLLPAASVLLERSVSASNVWRLAAYP